MYRVAKRNREGVVTIDDGRRQPVATFIRTGPNGPSTVALKCRVIGRKAMISGGPEGPEGPEACHAAGHTARVPSLVKAAPGFRDKEGDAALLAALQNRGPARAIGKRQIAATALASMSLTWPATALRASLSIAAIEAWGSIADTSTPPSTSRRITLQGSIAPTFGSCPITS